MALPNINPKKEAKDSLLENEKVKLDIWHWQDDRLQPQQLSELENDQKSTFLGVYDLSDNSIKILESDTLEVNKLDHRICILYDRREGTFYYYGSRNNN
ncbi:MAG: hypothetical protein EBS33_01370, partial [Alphaproteobacteria bacterium]|nr:hypothetical protein [Alphaproteobacteria bacterium]